MWPYGQTPPLEKCEQPDLKHPQAMLQNDICPRNSPRGVGGFHLLAHGLIRLIRKTLRDRAKLHCESHTAGKFTTLCCPGKLRTSAILPGEGYIREIIVTRVVISRI